MPTVNFSKTYVNELLKKDINILAERASEYGMDLTITDNEIILEATTERPDLLAPEGFVRVLRALQGEEPIPVRPVSSGKTIYVSESTQKIRPYISGLIAKNISLSNTSLEELIKFQNKISATFGRGGRKASIDCYDLDKTHGDIHYCTESIENIHITPIGENREQSLMAILKGHLLETQYQQFISDDKCVIIKDDQNVLLSAPPITYAKEQGTLSTDTKNILINVTGTSYATVHSLIEILSHNLHDIGGQIHSLSIQYPTFNEITPLMEPKKLLLNIPKINAVLGTNYDSIKIGRILKMANFSVNGANIEIPSYRQDILDSSDIAGEILSVAGIDALENIPSINYNLMGNSSKIKDYSKIVGDISQRMLLKEIHTFLLTDPERIALFNNNYIQTSNFKSNNYSACRNSLMPGILETLSKHLEDTKPLRVYEIGDVIIPQRTEPYETIFWGFGILDSKASFAQAKQIVKTMLTHLEKPFTVKECTLPCYIEGRAAELFVNEQSIGHFGEIHPRILKQHSILEPVVTGELDLRGVYDRNIL